MTSHTVFQGRGFTLVEALVTSAVVLLVFVGLYGAVQTSLKLLHNTKVSTGAVALANERIEYIRSLAYDDVGTDGGIPNGIIPQYSTTTLNNILFYERVLIQYVDAEDDGTGASDTNGILADYKQVKVELSWFDVSGTSSIFLLTNIVPPGIESTDGGGTLTVNVFDANVLPVSGAEVRIYNDTTTTTINTSRFTNADGIAMFAGAPAAANYQITVTKPGYSSDQTLAATTSNPNPVTSHVAVIESAVSTMNFQIDRLSDLRIRTVEPSTDGQFSDTFTNASLIATSTDVVLVSGSVVLEGGPSSYESVGSVQSTTTIPGSINAWDSILWDASVPASTTLTIQVYSDTAGVLTLIPDADLPQNSIGFTSSPIIITGLDPVTYPGLVIRGVLTSSNTATTSVLRSWEVNYIITEPEVPNIPFTMVGQKTIGTSPVVYKYNESLSTDIDGELALTDLEWDLYGITLGTTAYDIKEACGSLPYALEPNSDDTLTLTLVPGTLYSLRVHVKDITGNPITNADVDISRSGFSDNDNTSSCGQVFFNSGLVLESDYEVDISAPGYISQTISDVNIDGANILLVTLNEI